MLKINTNSKKSNTLELDISSNRQSICRPTKILNKYVEIKI